jgi:hypothetical protein
MGKIARNGGPIWENLWGWEIQFGTLFLIDISNSQQILKNSKDSESMLS